jgi:hypothetical protein
MHETTLIWGDRRLDEVVVPRWRKIFARALPAADPKRVLEVDDRIERIADLRRLLAETEFRATEGGFTFFFFFFFVNFSHFFLISSFARSPSDTKDPVMNVNLSKDERRMEGSAVFGPLLAGVRAASSSAKTSGAVGRTITGVEVTKRYVCLNMASRSRTFCCFVVFFFFFGFVGIRSHLTLPSPVSLSMMSMVYDRVAVGISNASRGGRRRTLLCLRARRALHERCLPRILLPIRRPPASGAVPRSPHRLQRALFGASRAKRSPRTSASSGMFQRAPTPRPTPGEWCLNHPLFFKATFLCSIADRDADLILPCPIHVISSSSLAAFPAAVDRAAAVREAALGIAPTVDGAIGAVAAKTAPHWMAKKLQIRESMIAAMVGNKKARAEQTVLCQFFFFKN